MSSRRNPRPSNFSFPFPPPSSPPPPFPPPPPPKSPTKQLNRSHSASSLNKLTRRSTTASNLAEKRKGSGPPQIITRPKTSHGTHRTSAPKLIFPQSPVMSINELVPRTPMSQTSASLTPLRPTNDEADLKKVISELNIWLESIKFLEQKQREEKNKIITPSSHVIEESQGPERDKSRRRLFQAVGIGKGSHKTRSDLPLGELEDSTIKLECEIVKRETIASLIEVLEFLHNKNATYHIAHLVISAYEFKLVLAMKEVYIKNRLSQLRASRGTSKDMGKEEKYLRQKAPKVQKEIRSINEEISKLKEKSEPEAATIEFVDLLMKLLKIKNFSSVRGHIEWFNSRVIPVRKDYKKYTAL